MRDYTQLSEQELTVECVKILDGLHAEQGRGVWFVVDRQGSALSMGSTESIAYESLTCVLRDKSYWQMLDEVTDYGGYEFHIKDYDQTLVIYGHDRNHEPNVVAIVSGKPSAAFKRALMIAFLQYSDTKKAK